MNVPSVPYLVFFLMLSFNIASATGQSSKVPDIIFINGDIYTQATPARAQAIAVRDGRVVAIGSNDTVLKLKQKGTEVVDLGGHFVMPGFNDAHCHLASGGMRQLEVDLTGTKSLAEMQQRIARPRENSGPGGMDSGWRLGPHSMGQPAVADETGSRCGDEWASGNFRPSGRPHCGGELGGIAGWGCDRPDSSSAGREDRPRCPGTADGHRPGVGAGAGLFQGAVANPIPAPSRCGAGAGKCGSIGNHLGAGQFGLGRFPDLRRTGARGQADSQDQ